jgi:hypothetical protein
MFLHRFITHPLIYLFIHPRAYHPPIYLSPTQGKNKNNMKIKFAIVTNASHDKKMLSFNINLAISKHFNIISVNGSFYKLT